MYCSRFIVRFKMLLAEMIVFDNKLQSGTNFEVVSIK